MTTLYVKTTKELVAEHLTTLKEYAKRVMLHDQPLTAAEQADKAKRMREFLAIGSSFRLTEHEMVGLLFKDLLSPRLRCGCYICRVRPGGEE